MHRNHLGTAFGGSTNAVAILACYAWLFNILKTRKISHHVVIKKSQISYLSPAKSDFEALCVAPAAEVIEKFMVAVVKKSRAQITLKAEVRTSSDVVCIFEGEFVAQK